MIIDDGHTPPRRRLQHWVSHAVPSWQAQCHASPLKSHVPPRPSIEDCSQSPRRPNAAQIPGTRLPPTQRPMTIRSHGRRNSTPGARGGRAQLDAAPPTKRLPALDASPSRRIERSAQRGRPRLTSDHGDFERWGVSGGAALAPPDDDQAYVVTAVRPRLPTTIAKYRSTRRTPTGAAAGAPRRPRSSACTRSTCR